MYTFLSTWPDATMITIGYVCHLSTLLLWWLAMLTCYPYPLSCWSTLEMGTYVESKDDSLLWAKKYRYRHVDMSTSKKVGYRQVGDAFYS